MKPKLHVRQANPTDTNRLLQIWRKAVDATHYFLSAADRQAIEAEVNAFLPQAPLWLAIDASDYPIGFMLLDGAHREALFVDPAHHGTGAGRALVEHALRLHPTLTTDVNEQNHQAAPKPTARAAPTPSSTCANKPHREKPPPVRNQPAQKPVKPRRFTKSHNPNRNRDLRPKLCWHVP